MFLFTDSVFCHLLSVLSPPLSFLVVIVVFLSSETAVVSTETVGGIKVHFFSTSRNETQLLFSVRTQDGGSTWLPPDGSGVLEQLLGCFWHG